ncbi:hypothetical protein GCM10029964_013790 [Kibdelosporangium lantanae]
MPTNGPVSIPCHTPRTTSTPRKPVAIPTSLRAFGRSAGTSISTNTSVANGVVAFHTPARTELIRVSPNENSGNGTVFSSSATTMVCHQTFGSRGIRSRLTRTIVHSAAAPNRQRSAPTYIGGTPAFTAILMNRNVDPQMVDNTANAGTHRWLMTPLFPLAPRPSGGFRTSGSPVGAQ